MQNSLPDVNFVPQQLAPETLVSKNASVCLKRKGGLCLSIEPDSASWTVLPPLYLQFWNKLPKACTWQQVQELEHPFSVEKRQDVLIKLHQRNFVSFNGHLYRNPERLFRRQNTYPSLICFHITEACNLACRYCMADAHPSKAAMSMETFKFIINKVLHELPNAGFTIDFHGGEPMLAFNKIEEAINYTEQINKKEKLGKELCYSFQTNGTLFNADNIKRILQLPNLAIGISLDGPQEVQDENRVFARNIKLTDSKAPRDPQSPIPGKGDAISHEDGTFNKVMENFRLASQMGLNLGILGVIHNPRDYIKSFNFFADDLKLRTFRLNYSSYIGRSARLLDFPLDRAADFAECWLAMIDHAYAYAKEHDICFNISDINNQLNNIVRRDRPFMCYRSPCGAGNSILGFATDGSIHACEEMASSGACRLAGIFDPGLNLKDLMEESPLIAQLNQRSVDNIPRCRRCAYRRFCTGGCTSKVLAFFGDIRHESPMCGYFQKVFEGLMLRLYEHPDMVHYLGGPDLKDYTYTPCFQPEQ